MGVLSATNPTLMDVRARLDPNDKIAAIIEVLSETNPMLEDMTFIEGNLTTGHRTTIRTGLPAVYWRTLNRGVPKSKSKTAQVDDSCGMLEAYAEVDRDLVALNGNTAAFRFSEDVAFMQSMNKEAATTLIYGNPSANPERFLGFAPRYSKRESDEDKAGYNIIVPGGSVSPNGADNTSIWLIGWGPLTIHGIYPKGSKGGLSFEDKGQVTLQDEAGNNYEGYRSHYKWDMGLCVRDWRFAVRIASIDLGQITDQKATQNLLTAMDEALLRIPTLSMCRPVFYARKEVISILTGQARNSAGSTITVQQITENKRMIAFGGVPIKDCQQILKTETPVA